MRGYPIGTQVETKERYVKVKISNGEWEGLGRNLLRNSGIEIKEGDRVFFADGNRLNRRVENLRRIHFSNTRYVLLSKSRVIYLPTKKAVAQEQNKLLVAKAMEAHEKATSGEPGGSTLPKGTIHTIAA